MKACESCNTEMDDLAGSCPKCGAKVNGRAAIDAEQHLHELISEANLLRIRRDFDEAIERCTEAIQLEPDNPEVHSLLGDIYASQGNLREAARWYEISIELRPECTIDMNKLERVQSRIAEAEGAYDPESDLSASETATPERYDVPIKYIVIICVVAVLIFLASGIRSWIMAGMGGVGTPEIPAAVQTSQTNADPQSAELSTRPFSEQNLLNTIATSPMMTNRHIIIEDVRIDPRRKLIAITFWSARPPQKPSRKLIIEDAAAVAIAAFKVDKDASLVTTRGIIHLPGQTSVSEPILAFLCDFPRSAEKLTPEDVAGHPSSIVGNIWWGPQVPPSSK